VGGDLLEHSLSRARWVVVASTGGIEPELMASVRRAWKKGAALSLGPYLPDRDAALQAISDPPTPPKGARTVPALLGLGAESMAEAVAAAQKSLDLPVLAAAPGELLSTVHVDAQGVARVLFVINPSAWAAEATVSAAGARVAVDALDGARFEAHHGSFGLPVSGRSVRMLELVHED